MPKIKIILILKILIFLSILGLTFFIFCQQSDLTSLDLGRHIKNGEIVWQDKDVLYKNFYSYTEPDFPFINHHWLSGVIFYFLYLAGGFKLLSIFNILIALFTVSLIFYHAYKRSNFWLTAILILPVVLIMSERTDIRPEIFSYLFLVAIFYLLDKFRKTNDYKYLIWLIPIQLIWINLHVYFFLGLFLICLVLLEKLITNSIKSRSIIISFKNYQKLIYITVACFIISLANPHFIRGLLYPFNILKKYGYEIVENKSPLYLENLMINYNILIFKILIGILIISYVVLFIVKIKTKKSLINFNGFNVFYIGLTAFFVFIAFFAIRNLPIFALMILPIAANNFYSFRQIIKNKNKLVTNRHIINLNIFIFIFILYIIFFSWIAHDLNGNNYYLKNKFGIGLVSGYENSLNFFNGNNLVGPIFNNYDFGSALAFWLYPQEKIFVDNRPEAYSLEFFTDIYKPMQADEEKWEEFSAKYNINLIYFSHTDGTPWARNFLGKRLNDNKWPLIYFDLNNVIMIKNIPANEKIITKYKIDNNKFEEKINKLMEIDGLGGKNKILMNLAGLSSLYGQEDIAKKIYEKILEKQPKNRLTLAAIGYLYSNSIKKEEVIKSLSYFNKAILAGHKLSSVYNQMGLIYWNLEDYGEAKKMWQTALKINSKDDHAKYYLEQAEELLK